MPLTTADRSRRATHIPEDERCPGSVLAPVEGRCEKCRVIMAVPRSGRKWHRMPRWMVERGANA